MDSIVRTIETFVTDHLNVRGLYFGELLRLLKGRCSWIPRGEFCRYGCLINNDGTSPDTTMNNISFLNVEIFSVVMKLLDQRTYGLPKEVPNISTRRLFVLFETFAKFQFLQLRWCFSIISLVSPKIISPQNYLQSCQSHSLSLLWNEWFCHVRPKCAQNTSMS